MARKKKPPKRRNPEARALTEPKYRQRIVPDKRKRKPKHALRHEGDA